MAKIPSNWKYLIFQGGRSPQLLSVIERSWNYGNMPYLVANTYGLNFIKIGGIWIFQGGEPPVRGITCDLRCPFSNFAELFQSKVTCENLVRIGWAFQELSFEISWGQKLPIRGITCDLQCPSSNMANLLQSKVMCENLVSNWLSLSRVIMVTIYESFCVENHPHPPNNCFKRFFDENQ